MTHSCVVGTQTSGLLFRLQVNLKQVLAQSELPAGRHFECLCERDRVRLWPWLRDRQVECLTRCLQERPPFDIARHVLDSCTNRFAALRSYAPHPRHIDAVHLLHV